MDIRTKAMTERNDETVRRMHEDRIRLEAQLSAQRTDCERIKTELESKSTQRDHDKTLKYRNVFLYNLKNTETLT